jgi:uncharacterized membrane protein YbhN (UPF0104 family)
LTRHAAWKPRLVLTTLRRHPHAMLLAGLALATGGIFLMGWLAGWPAFADALDGFAPQWMAVAAGGQLLAYGGYVVAYRAVMCFEPGAAELSLPLSLRLVVAGFGAFDPGGGFGVDQRAMHAIEGDMRSATVRALALGGVEYAVVAPAACVAAIVLLVVGTAIHGAVLWPWAIAVPLGFVVALPLAARREALVRGRTGRLWVVLDHALEGISVLPDLARERVPALEAFGGCALYWAGEAISLWGAVRTFGEHLAVGPLIVAVATGYALTRRSMPLGGAGITEVLMSYALSWAGVPLPVAVAGVVVYRVFAFAVPMIPGLWARRGIASLLYPEAAPAAPARGYAGAP